MGNVFYLWISEHTMFPRVANRKH